MSPNRKALPNTERIQHLERKALRRLTELARMHDIEREKLARGRMRIRTKAKMARTMIQFMRQNKLTSLEQLADALYVGYDYSEVLVVLSWMRFPCALQGAQQQSETDDEYLLAICEQGT